MVYRVDYLLGLILAGAALGALFSKRTSHIESGRLASGFYTLMAVRVVLGAVFLACGIVLANQPRWNRIGTGLSDASNLLLGALLGLALLRNRRLELLRQPSV